MHKEKHKEFFLNNWKMVWAHKHVHFSVKYWAHFTFTLASSAFKRSQMVKNLLALTTAWNIPSTLSLRRSSCPASNPALKMWLKLLQMNRPFLPVS